MRTLRGKFAVVTGAGGGMGRVYVHQLASLGADVAVLDVDLNVSKRYNERLYIVSGAGSPVTSGRA
jgi:NAD(P)-dependent dehydrogenase (short-subunit alcohol dehydrogenase family)